MQFAKDLSKSSPIPFHIVINKGKFMPCPPFVLVAVLAVVFSLPALAQTTRYSNWQVDLSSIATLTDAYTVNESGSVFGFICSATVNRCSYYVASNTTCNSGSKSAILINSEAGALASTIICTKFGNDYYNAIENTIELNNGVAISKTLGIALPMKDGRFKVVRFSLDGANSAIKAAATRAMELEKTMDHMQ